jgi:hypothetical protein
MCADALGSDVLGGDGLSSVHWQRHFEAAGTAQIFYWHLDETILSGKPQIAGVVCEGDDMAADPGVSYEA